MVKKIFRIPLLYWLLISIIFFASELKGTLKDNDTKIFSPRFKTLKIERSDNFMAPPVLILGSGARLIISFDEIGEDNSYLSARLVHCNSDWEPSQLVESEYIEGFNTIDLEDYAYSTNTFVHYVNYLLEIPSEDFRPLVSGNYLLQVYDRDEPDRTLLQARFRVVEPMAGVTGSITSRTDKGFNDKYQQLSIAVDGENADISNPYQDVKIVVEQNGNDYNSRTITNPLRTMGKNVIYDHNPLLIFPASNEYRRFESTSTRFPGMRVDSVKYMGTNYHVWVNTDYPRADSNYEYDQTQHGRFLVKEYNATDSNIGADYITVHFFLDTPELIGKDVYVDGEVTHGNFDSFNRMTYNGATGGYELAMPLKQGAYNYRYVTKTRDENGRISDSEIEGDKYETENEYGIYVYMRKPGERYDRLIGHTILTGLK
ncbi:MAG: DUF5103 domain-containing protein [Muribaculaceae bacterium]|nr:DUF5103 domain-containing protein [Muribaculaceae bacterium]